MKTLSGVLSIAIQICCVVAIAVGARSLAYWHYNYVVAASEPVSDYSRVEAARYVADGALWLALGAFGLLTAWVNTLCCSRQGRSPEGGNS